jgi:hypothetical protein
MPNCFVCDHSSDSDAFLIERNDGSSYPIPICLDCQAEIIRLPEPIRLASQLMDFRNTRRARST